MSSLRNYYGNLTSPNAGVWVPEVADAVNGGNIATGTIQTATYNKDTKLCHIQCHITGISTVGLTPGNPVRIRNLPAMAKNLTVGSVRVGNVTFSGFLVCQTEAGGNSIVLRQIFNAAGSSNVTVAGLLSGSAEIMINLAYMI